MKNSTRDKRGVGIRRKVTSKGLLPSNWKTFLRCNENKAELFPFLSNILVSEISNKFIVATCNENVLSNEEINYSELMPSNIEEADERMFVHVMQAANDNPRILIKTVDSDVVIIVIATYHKINSLRELWIEFRAGKYLRFIPVHEIFQYLGPEKSQALLFLHAFSGCDTVSTLSGKGKKIYFDNWMSMSDELTPIFCRLPGIESTNDISDLEFQFIETFVIRLYSKTCNTNDVNEARKILFARENRQIENIPPTRAALKQHLYRSILQASKWNKALEKMPIIGDPSLWGWYKENDSFVPYWTNLPEAANVCRELIKCNCKKSCSGRCKCFKANLQCTELCGCLGQCSYSKV